jgi:hypothetical protein
MEIALSESTATEDEAVGGGIEIQTVSRVLGKHAARAGRYGCAMPVLWRGTNS